MYVHVNEWWIFQPVLSWVDSMKQADLPGEKVNIDRAHLKLRLVFDICVETGPLIVVYLQ